MRRFLFVLVLPMSATGALLVGVASCGSNTATAELPSDDAAPRKEGGAVLPADGGTYDSGPAGPPPECSTYCDLVMTSCTGIHAQYASAAECLAFCGHLPKGKGGEVGGNSVACRQYYAGSPARLDATGYCLAAGPFGGGVCGDRCQSFCELTLDACSPEAGAAPYASYPDCQSACVGFVYRDGGVDGGGEPPTGPSSGDTLNCRLYYARAAVADGTTCADLAVDSGACR
jgi:hypothetical protein